MRSDEERMAAMEQCPCCGLTSSAGHDARETYYGVLSKLARYSLSHGDQQMMVDAAKEYLSNVTTSVSSSARPNKVANADSLHDIQQAAHLLRSALEVE